MWTPRRILLMVAGLTAFVAAYFGYTLFLGSIDGLPQLPQRYLLAADPGRMEFERPSRLAVEERLEQAFGPHCPELEDPAYKTKIELRDRGIVFASGPLPEVREPSRKLRITPFSLALFSKPKPGTPPTQTPDIMTLHADEAVLEFDKPVTSRQDLFQGATKLTGIELVSNPEADYRDLRKGRIIVTANQGQADPSQWMIVRTAGPVFYQTGESGKPLPADVPSIRTSAPVEIENRANLPRPLWGQRLLSVATKGDELRGPHAVSDIVFGLRAPPPTITAVGLKVYLAADPDAPPPKANSKGMAVSNRLQRIELMEQVQFNVWTDGASGFPGTDEKSKAAARKLHDEPPMALAAVSGALSGGMSLAERERTIALMTIETLGAFRFDVITQIARFETAPTANPSLANNIELSRVFANGVRDTLICQSLDVGFDKVPRTPENAAAPSNGTPATGFKFVQASGPFVRLDSETDKLIAQGTYLRYDTDRAKGHSVFVFRGQPIDAVKDRNRLTAGTAQKPTELIFETTELRPVPQPGRPPDPVRKLTSARILGPGQATLYDPASKDSTLSITWTRSFVQSMDRIGDVDHEVLTFQGGQFKDTKAGFSLAADELRLWLRGSASSSLNGKSGSAPTPVRLLANGHVIGSSPDMKIEDTESLTVHFQDPERIAVAPVPTMPGIGQAPPAAGLPQPGKTPPATAKAAPPIPNPIRLTARTIESWITRTPIPSASAPNNPSMKYDLTRAVCRERVDVHQAPADPRKAPRGLDIRCANLTLERNTINDLIGYSAEIAARPGELAELHYENLSLAGPAIVIDQLANFVRIIGAGAIRMPTGSGFSGQAARPADPPLPGPPGQPGELQIEWTERMEFRGADGIAQFQGNVQARQETILPPPPVRGTDDATFGKSWVVCHRLDVRFDRPVYFNQFRKPGEAEAPPKIAQAICRTLPEEDAGVVPRAEAVVLFEDEQFRRDHSVARKQRIKAKSLEFRGVDREATIVAGGPGEVRSMQMGARDWGRSKPKTAGPATDEQELKLTVVRFQNQMRMRDNGQKFQEATFEGDVVAIHLPTPEFEKPLDRHSALPERSLILTCDDTLTVSTHRKPNGKTEQRMNALGNSQFKNDEFRGRGHRIDFDGTLMTLEGIGNRLATIERASKQVGEGTATPARKITYNTLENKVELIDGAAGAFQGR